MVPVLPLISFFLAHLYGDFFLQTEEMARKKSKDIYVLAKHVSTYILPFVFVAFFNLVLAPVGERESIGSWTMFLVVNLLLHFVTDFFTSKLSSKMWNEGKTSQFFQVIGMDQTIHYITIILTTRYILF